MTEFQIAWTRTSQLLRKGEYSKQLGEQHKGNIKAKQRLTSPAVQLQGKSMVSVQKLSDTFSKHCIVPLQVPTGKSFPCGTTFKGWILDLLLALLKSFQVCTSLSDSLLAYIQKFQKIIWIEHRQLCWGKTDPLPLQEVSVWHGIQPPRQSKQASI